MKRCSKSAGILWIIICLIISCMGDLSGMNSEFNIGWYTPYMVFNLSTKNDGVFPASYHKKLSNYALKFFDKFVSNVDMYKAMSEDKDEPDTERDMNYKNYKSTNNDLFYHFQNQMFRLGKLFDSDEYPHIDVPQELFEIKDAIRQMAGEFLYLIGLKRKSIDKIIFKTDQIESLLEESALNGKANENTIRYHKNNLQKKKQETSEEPTDEEIESMQDFQMWATVHSNGSRHSSHDHELAIVSGVYFTKGASDNNGGSSIGNLILEDPRGLGYPFGMKHIHKPIEGQVVLFPGYLVHEVKPTKSKTPRVSFAFNFDGEWKDISDKTGYYRDFGHKRYNVNKHKKKQKIGVQADKEL